MSQQKPKVCIILVNWNGLADTRECLASLSQITYPNAQVLLVDNGSRDDQAQTLRVEFPAITVIETGDNLGFTGGNNVGIKYALAEGADYVLCLNNDTVVDAGFLEPLVAVLEDDPGAGLAVSKIFYYDDPDVVWYAGAVCQLDTETFTTIGGPAWHLPDKEQNTGAEPFEAQIATGCALLVRAPLMRELEGFDDRYFAYYEDVDLSLRAEKMGIKRLVVPASRVWHKESRSTGGAMSPTAMFYLIRNTRLLALLHAPGGDKAAEEYYRLYLRHWEKTARNLARLKDVSERDMERAVSIYHAVWCATRNLYGRRETASGFEAKIARRFLAGKKFHRVRQAAVSLWNATFMRVFWYFSYHIRRKLLQPKATG